MLSVCLSVLGRDISPPIYIPFELRKCSKIDGKRIYETDKEPGSRIWVSGEMFDLKVKWKT